MLKVTKFGGSSMADAGQYRKVRDIVLADPDRRVVIVSAAGKRFKDDQKEVATGYECGVGLEKFNDIKEGDILEAFIVEEYKD